MRKRRKGCAIYTVVSKFCVDRGGRIARSARRRRRSHDSEERDSKKDYFRGVTIRIRIISLTHGFGDSRLQESKVNFIADEDADLIQLTNDVNKVGPRFTEEVFLYSDRIETRPFAAKNQAIVSAQASPAHSKFRPKVPFDDDDDDDDDNDFSPPKPKSAKNNALGESAKSNALGESESERTNVETHRRSPKKGSPKEHLSVDDDDEGDALPTEVASPKQPQSKAMKTSFSAPPSAVTFIFHAIAVSCFHYFPAVSANALRPPPT